MTRPEDINKINDDGKAFNGDLKAFIPGIFFVIAILIVVAIMFI